MPYFTGTATSASDLITAITNAAVANGWTLNTGTILTKGNVNAQLTEYNPRDNTISAKGVGVQAGTGQSGGSLTGACNNIAGMRTDLYTAGYFVNSVPLSYPCTYHIFINTTPDEIVVAVNHNALYWQWLGFGQATTIGVTGTGIYCWGSFIFNTGGHINPDTLLGFNINATSSNYNQAPCFWTVCDDYFFASLATSHIHLSLDSLDWWTNNGATDLSYPLVKCYYSVGDPLRLQPNTWNNEALLCRTQIMAARPSGFHSYVAELPHFRYTRNTFFDDGEVITLGTDDWFVAPIYKKDLTTPEGAVANYAAHSGTCAFAVRKTA